MRPSLIFTFSLNKHRYLLLFGACFKNVQPVRAICTFSICCTGPAIMLHRVCNYAGPAEYS